MSKIKQIAEKPLSESHKKELNRIVEFLNEYLGTTEGIQMLDRFESLCAQIHSNNAPVISLTPNEEKALKFIRRELKEGRSPTVREVTKAIGLRSSRSGHRIVKALKQKQVL